MWAWLSYCCRHNPVLQKAIEKVTASQQVHTPLGRGRCFIRAALNAKIISVPVEQLAKNHKLTNVSIFSYHGISKGSHFVVLVPLQLPLLLLL